MESNLIFSKSQQISESVRNGKVLIGSINNNKEPNFMTIGWGMIGNIWYEPVFITYIRPNRYTFNNLKNHPYFTVNIFFDEDHKDILDYCGSVSFHEENKIKSKNIDYKLNKNNIPYHEDSDIVLDCKVIYESNLDDTKISKKFREKYYPDDNYHTAFYGKILTFRS